MNEPPVVEVALGVVWKNGLVLIAQRPLEKFLGGLWEFPGGKPEPGESLAACVRREVREELGVEVEVQERLAPITFRYPDRTVTLHPFTCRWKAGEPRPLGCQAWRWAAPEELAAFEFPPASAPIVEALIRGPGAGRGS